jgi:hypothetical protein
MQQASRHQTMSPEDFKVYENRLRRMARRQGLRLAKYRVRDTRALNYRCYYLINQDNVHVGAVRMQIDDVERYLLGD